MKKLVLLLMTLLVLSALVSSPALAARRSLDFRIHSMFGILYRSIMLARGIVVVPETIVPIQGGGSTGAILGGDADDYGNGRWSDETDIKPINKLVGSSLLGPEEHGPDAPNSVTW